MRTKQLNGFFLLENNVLRQMKDENLITIFKTVKRPLGRDRPFPLSSSCCLLYFVVLSPFVTVIRVKFLK